MTTCKHCGAENAVGSKFCNQCGTRPMFFGVMCVFFSILYAAGNIAFAECANSMLKICKSADAMEVQAASMTVVLAILSLAVVIAQAILAKLSKKKSKTTTK